MFHSRGNAAYLGGSSFCSLGSRTLGRALTPACGRERTCRTPPPSTRPNFIKGRIPRTKPGQRLRGVSGRLDHPPTRGKWTGGTGAGPKGAIVKATTVIYLRAAETAASNRTHSRRGTATTGAGAGDRVTTSPRAAPPIDEARWENFLHCRSARPSGLGEPCSAPAVSSPRPPASSSRSRCSRVWRRRRRMLKTTTTNRSARRPRPRRPSATTTTSRQPSVARRASAAPHRLAAPRRPSHAAHCWQLFSLCGRTYMSDNANSARTCSRLECCRS